MQIYIGREGFLWSPAVLEFIAFVPGKRKKECDNCRRILLYVEDSNEFWSNLYIFTVNQKIAFIKKLRRRCFSFISEQFVGWEQAIQCCSKVLYSSISCWDWPGEEVAQGLFYLRQGDKPAGLYWPPPPGTRAHSLFSTIIQELCFEISSTSNAI